MQGSPVTEMQKRWGAGVGFFDTGAAQCPGADLRFVQGDVRPVHEQVRAAASEKNIWLGGGGELMGQFHDAALLDELIVQVGSVTLGSGKPLLPRQITSPPLRLISARRTGPGFAELRYEVAPRS